MKLIRYFKNHPLAFLMSAILITALIVYHKYFFGGYVFLFEEIGSDTKQQYIAFFNSIAHHIRQGDLSFWDATWGFGTSMFSMNLFHPTLLLLYLIGALFGPEYIAGSLIYIHLLHLLLAGLGAWLFLSSFRLSKRSRFIAAYIYSFNGYIVIWGQHYHFALFLFFLPLLLCLIERSFFLISGSSPFDEPDSARRSKRAFLLLPVSAAVMCLSSYYLSFMTALTCLLYIVLRLAFIEGLAFSVRLKAFLSRGLMLLLGAGIGLIYMLPSFLLVALTSQRLSSGSLLARLIAGFHPYDRTYYLSFFKKLCSSALEGIGIYVEEYTGYVNVYEAPNVFFTGLLLILIIQFIIFFPKIVKAKRHRIVIGLSLLITAAICFVPAGSLVFNGFNYPFSRHLFVLMPFFAMVTAWTLDFMIKNGCFSVIGALLSTAFTAFFCLCAIPSLVSDFLKFNAFWIFLSTLLMAVLFFLAVKKKLPLKKYAFMFLALLTASQLLTNTFSTVHRRAVIRNDSEYFSALYGTDDDQADAYLEANETEYYRLEKTYAAGSEVMDSLIQDYRGISGYNSTTNKYVLEFADTIVPNLRRTDNNNWLSFRNIIDRPVLCELFGIKYVLTKEKADALSGYSLAAEFDNTYLYEREGLTFAHFFENTITEDAFETAIETKDPDDILSDYLILDGAACDITDGSGIIPDIDSPLTEDLSAKIHVPESSDDGHIQITVSSEDAGWLFVPVPYESGWSASSDGAAAEIVQADYGFMAVYLTPGSHLVELSYDPPGLTASLFIAFGCLIIYVLIIILSKRKSQALTAPGRKRSIS